MMIDTKEKTEELIKKGLIKTKKGVTQIWWIIITAVIAFVVVFLVLFWFQGSGGRLFAGIEEQIGGLKDQDKDGATDLFDQCPCDPNIGSELAPGQSCGPPLAGCIP